MAGVLGSVVVRVPNEIRELMTAGSPGRIDSAPRVMELRPRDGDEVRAVRDVEVAVGTVGNVVVIEPQMLTLSLHRDCVGATRAVVRVVCTIEADDLETANNHVDRSVQSQMANKRGAADA